MLKRCFDQILKKQRIFSQCESVYVADPAKTLCQAVYTSISICWVTQTTYEFELY